MKKTTITCLWIIFILAPFSHAQNIFADISQETGTRFFHHVPSNVGIDFQVGTGAAWLDMDNDGDLDLYVTQRDGQNFLFRNNWIGLGELSFSNITEGDALALSADGAGVSVADYDNDGDLDIYLANSNEDILLQNDGLGHFIDITSEAFPGIDSLVPGRGTSASWGDINQDGWLDLYVSNHFPTFDNPNQNSQDYLFLNLGGNPVSFQDISDVLAGDQNNNGTDDRLGYGFVAGFTDFDNDGDLDIYATNDCPLGPESNKLWRNDGNLTFTEVSQQVGPFILGKELNGVSVPDCQAVMGLATSDVNRDGRLDYFFTNFSDGFQSNILLLNSGQQLINATQRTGLQQFNTPNALRPIITWGTNFLDYDLDGWQDIYICSGTLFDNFPYPNLLYRNQGLARGANQEIISLLPQFQRIAESESGVANLEKSRTSIVGDFDLDGDPDLYVVNFNGNSALYQNQQSSNHHWLQILLQGQGAPLSNKNGIGAKIILHLNDDLAQLQEIKSGSSLGGGDDLAAYFGLGEHRSARVEIQWPSGMRQWIQDIEIDQRIQIEEPKLGFTKAIDSEIFTMGDTVHLAWKSSLDFPVNLYLLNGEEKIQLAKNLPASASFAWSIDQTMFIGKNLQLQISQEGSAIESFYFQTFEIVDSQTSYIYFEQPLANSLFLYDSLCTISWQGQLPTNESFRMALYRGEQEILSLSSTHTAKGQTTWQVQPLATNSNYRWKAISTNNQGVLGKSEAFSIFPPFDDMPTESLVLSLTPSPNSPCPLHPYPNPAHPSELVRLKNCESVNNLKTTLKIFSLTGVLMQQSIWESRDILEFSTEGLPSGSYILSLQSQNNIPVQTSLLLIR